MSDVPLSEYQRLYQINVFWEYLFEMVLKDEDLYKQLRKASIDDIAGHIEFLRHRSQIEPLSNEDVRKYLKRFLSYIEQKRILETEE